MRSRSATQSNAVSVSNGPASQAPMRARLPGSRGLLQALAGLTHERDRFGEDGRHDGADLLRLLLRGALDVDPVDRRDGHVDRELDRVVGPGQRLRRLHLLGHLLHATLEVWVVEEAAETFHGLNCTGGRARAASVPSARAWAWRRARPRP